MYSDVGSSFRIDVTCRHRLVWAAAQCLRWYFRRTRNAGEGADESRGMRSVVGIAVVGLECALKRIMYVVPALVALIALVAGSVFMARAANGDTTYYACLYAGTLSQVNTNGYPANCGRGVPVSWSQQGPKGDQGDKGDQGEPGLTWQGDWDDEYNAPDGYATDDAVHHDGSAWISLVDNNTEEPGDTALNWDLLAAQGEQGEQGEKGDTGVITGANIYVNDTFETYAASPGYISQSASCNTGDTAIGGGHRLLSAGEGSARVFTEMGSSRPVIVSGKPTGWFVSGQNPVQTNGAANTSSLRVYVICLDEPE